MTRFSISHDCLGAVLASGFMVESRRCAGIIYGVFISGNERSAQ